MKQLVPDFGSLGHAATPGLCYICGSPQQGGDRGVVSTGKWIEAEGVMEICSNCVIELAALVGCLAPGAVDSLKEQNDDLRKSNRGYGRQVKALLAELDAVHVRLEVAEERLK